MSEKLCLKWNDFQDNTNSAFGSLRIDIDFSDVTLACEDGNQMEAHKVILAASSPFFKNILTKNKHPHPLIYMRGIKSEDLIAIVDFLYYGEANVYEESIDAFLAIAEELNLKGMTGNSSAAVSIQDVDALPAKSKRKQVSQGNKPLVELNQSYDTYYEKEENHSDSTAQTETTVVLPSYGVINVNISDRKELDDHVKSMMRKSENLVKNGHQKANICTVCGKEGNGRDIKDHIEANHLEGVSLSCNCCEKTFRTRSALRSHSRLHTNYYQPTL